MESNHKSIITTMLLAVFMLVVVFIITSILTSGGNSVGNLFKYLIPCIALYAFAKPKHAIYTLFIISPFLDQVKRFMIFDSRLTEFDLALILATAPILMAMVFLRTAADCMFTPNKDNRRILLWMFVVGLIMLIFVLANSGSAAYSGLRGFGQGVNAGIYMLLIPILPRYFSDRSEYAKLLLVCTFVYIVPALWCIKQGLWGLADFEDKYVRYGLSGEIRQLNERVFRNPGTMAGASAMSCAASIFLALYLIPVIMKTGKKKLFILFMPHRLLLYVLFGTCMYYTYTRTPWFAVIAAVTFFICLHSRVLLLSLGLSGVISLTSLYLSAQWIFDQQILNKWQVALINKFGGDAGLEQTLVLGTLNGRLESMANLVHGRDHVLQPFGVPLAKFFGATEAFDIKQHDIVTEYVYKFGYIPCILLAIGLAIVGVKFVGMNGQLKDSPERNSARVYLAIFVGIQTMGLSHGAILQTYPLNMFIAFFLAAAIYHYRLALRAASQGLEHMEPLHKISRATSVRMGHPIGTVNATQNS